MKKIAFIGAGNMAKAMITCLVEQDLFKAENVYASTKTNNLDDELKVLNINHSFNNKEIVYKSDIIVLAIKPQFYKAVIDEIKAINLDNKIIISIAAGITIEFLEENLGKDAKILRTMPNTPVMIGKGITAICPNKNLSKAELDELKPIFESFGIVEEIDENLFDVIIAISGSSPAYIFMIIESMADAAVSMGLSRTASYRLAANAMIGSAELMLKTGKHPAVLKDMVTSPKGTTIEAVKKFEEKGLRTAIIEGMMACYEKSKGL